MLRCSYWCSAACSSCVASQQRSYFSGSCRTASAVRSATPRRHVSRLVACCVSCPGFAPAGASPAAGTACIGSRRGLPHRRLSVRKRIRLQPVLRVGCSGADPMFGRIQANGVAILATPLAFQALPPREAGRAADARPAEGRKRPATVAGAILRRSCSAMCPSLSHSGDRRSALRVRKDSGNTSSEEVARGLWSARTLAAPRCACFAFTRLQRWRT